MEIETWITNSETSLLIAFRKILYFDMLEICRSRPFEMFLKKIISKFFVYSEESTTCHVIEITFYNG